MGLRAEIAGLEFRFSGHIAEILVACGVTEEDRAPGVVVMTRDKAKVVFSVIMDKRLLWIVNEMSTRHMVTGTALGEIAQLAKFVTFTYALGSWLTQPNDGNPVVFS
jgi:hypothetical protein